MNDLMCLLLLALMLISVTQLEGQRTKEAEKRYNFIQFDQNGDGYLDASEIRAFFPQLSPEDLSIFFIKVDTNQNGIIEFKEYQNAYGLNQENDRSKVENK